MIKKFNEIEKIKFILFTQNEINAIKLIPNVDIKGVFKSSVADNLIQSLWRKNDLIEKLGEADLNELAQNLCKDNLSHIERKILTLLAQKQ